MFVVVVEDGTGKNRGRRRVIAPHGRGWKHRADAEETARAIRRAASPARPKRVTVEER